MEIKTKIMPLYIIKMTEEEAQDLMKEFFDFEKIPGVEFSAKVCPKLYELYDFLNHRSNEMKVF